MPKELMSITDDSRINVNPEMYDTYIKEALVYYKGNFPKVKYRPSIGNDGRHEYIKERPFNALNMTKAMCRRMASIIFGKTAEYSFENEQLGVFINDVFQQNRFNDNLQENLKRRLQPAVLLFVRMLKMMKLKLRGVTPINSIRLKAIQTKLKNAALRQRLLKPVKKRTNTRTTHC